MPVPAVLLRGAHAAGQAGAALGRFFFSPAFFLFVLGAL